MKIIYEKDAIDALHKTMLEFFKTDGDDEPEFITASERMLLSVNKAISNALKALPSAQQTTCKYWDTESDFCALYRPSVQSEIITCKDCKHGMYDMMCKFYWCHGVAHSANWFCADGKRRE